jgi:hypothetical protein
MQRVNVIYELVLLIPLPLKVGIKAHRIFGHVT